MSSLQNLANQRSNTSTSSSTKENPPKKTKLNGLATMIINAITPSRCIASIPMVVCHQRIGKIILDHLCKKGTMQLSTRGLPITVSEAVHRAETAVTAEARTLSNLRTASFMAVKPITAQKITPYSLSQKERWSKTPNNLCNNHHPEKSTIPYSGPLTTMNTLHLTLRLFCSNPTKAAKPNLQLITNRIITSQPIIHNLCQLHK
jgi:hypothetical protein